MEQDLDFLADEIKKFYEIKRIYILGDGAFVGATPKNKKVFEICAQICKELDAEPEIFVQAQFAYNNDPKKLAEIAPFLHGEVKNGRYLKAISNYQDYLDGMTVPLQKWYELQINYLCDQVELVGRPIVRALMDDNLTLKPWFRVCITKEPVKEIIDKYAEDARNEYLKSKKLQAFLKEKNLDHTRFI